MTSTPALGALSELEDYDKVAAGYAATYAAALLNIIFMIQLINFIMG